LSIGFHFSSVAADVEWNVSFGVTRCEIARGDAAARSACIGRKNFRFGARNLIAGAQMERNRFRSGRKQMSAIRISSPEQFSAELEKLKGLSTKPPAAVAQPEPSFAPLTLEQVNAKIEEFSLALEGPLPDPVRAEIERRRAALVKEQFRLRVGYIPDADGNNPAEVKAIVDAATESATQKIFETLAAAPAESSTEADVELIPDVDEDAEEDDYPADDVVEVLNEADAAVVSAKSPATPLQLVLSEEVTTLLRAAVAENWEHVVMKVLREIFKEQ
jgi:hypothetical protein